MIARAVRIALALEMLLVCIGGALPLAASWLPLGGSHLSQVGLCLGLAVAGVELFESLIQPRSSGRPTLPPGESK